MKNNKKIAQVAAKWWRNKIKNPRFDNGATDIGNQMAQMLAYLNTSDISNEKLDKFEQILAAKIEEKLSKTTGFFITVDYNPDAMLASSAEEAGIPDTNFPWKTYMSVNKNDGIEVSAGYGAPYENIPIE